MGRQRNIHSKEHLKRLRKSHSERPVGFYKKGGKTRPITKAKPKKKPRVVKVVKTTKPASAQTPPVQVQRPSEPYDARWRSWITGLITKAGEDPHLVDVHIRPDGVDIIPKWAPGSVFDRENMKKYEATMELIKAPWNASMARWELRDLIPIWVNPLDGYWETDTDAAPRGAKAFYVTREELHRHNQRNSNDIRGASPMKPA